MSWDFFFDKKHINKIKGYQHEPLIISKLDKLLIGII